MLTAGNTGADPPNRAQYVALLEPVCKRTVKTNLGDFKDVRSEVRSGHLTKAARHFSQAANNSRNSLKQLEAFERPEGEEQTLFNWFKALNFEVGLLDKAAAALKANEKKAVLHYVRQIHQNATRANRIVLNFGFAYCTLDPGRFV